MNDGCFSYYAGNQLLPICHQFICSLAIYHPLSLSCEFVNAVRPECGLFLRLFAKPFSFVGDMSSGISIISCARSHMLFGLTELLLLDYRQP